MSLLDLPNSLIMKIFKHLLPTTLVPKKESEDVPNTKTNLLLYNQSTFNYLDFMSINRRIMSITYQYLAASNEHLLQGCPTDSGSEDNGRTMSDDLKNFYL